MGRSEGSTWTDVLRQRNHTARDPLAESVCVVVIIVVVGFCFTDRGQSILTNALEPHTSEIDWCETNYAVTPHVAEFWNTLSSLPMLLV